MQLDDQNRILIPVSELVPAVFSKAWYDQAKYRGKIDTVIPTGQRAGRGRGVFVVYDTLCEKYQLQIRAALGDPRQAVGLVPADQAQGSGRKAERVPFNELSAKELALCNAKYNLVKAYRQYAEINGPEMGLVAAKKEFVRAVQDGYLCPDSYPVVGKLSFQTLERWNKELRDGGDKMDVLAPLRVKKSGRSLTPAQQQVLIKEYCKDNKPSVAVSYRMACRIWRAQGTPVSELPTLITCRRFLNDWSSTHQKIVTFNRDGLKKLREKVLPSLERDPDSLQYLDCLVADGKVLNMTIAHPDTGKPCRATLIGWMDFRSMQILGFELMVTENTMSVASAFRHACINAGRLLGVDGAVLPRSVYMDNGSAFKNRFFNEQLDLATQVGGLFERLKEFGLEHVQYAKPYNARTKNIERAWEMFIEMEGLADTFVGDRLENKPAALMRNEKWHRERREGLIAKNGLPTLWGAYQACEWWIGEYNNLVGNGKYLDGISPNQLAAQQATQINFRNRIMRGTEVDCMIMHSKTLKLKPNGFKIGNITYYNYLFADRVRVNGGEEYIVRYDLRDRGRVLVFNEDGSFWCEAKEYFGQGLHAMAALGSDADQAKVRSAQQQLAALEKQAVSEAISLGMDPIALPELPQFTTPSPHAIAPAEPEEPAFRLF